MVKVPNDYPAAPSGAPLGSRDYGTYIGRLPSGVRLMYKFARAAPSRRHRIQDARTSEDAKTVHRTAPGRTPAGRRPGPNREPCGVPVHRTEPGSLPHGTGPAPLRCVRFVDGRLAITLHLFSPDYRPGAVQYVTTHAVEMKIVRDPYGL